MAVTIIDMATSYTYLQVRGRVVQISEDGAVEHIILLAKKYTNRDEFGVPEGQTRVLYKIKPN